MMLASASQEIKFHDWESTKLVGLYKPYTDKPKHNTFFNDLTWNCDGTYLAGVQASGKALLLKPTTTIRTDLFVPERDVVNCGCVKCAHFSRTQNNIIALGTTVGHLLHYNLASKYSTVLVHDFPGCANRVTYACGDAYIGVACANGQIFIVQAGMGITEAYFVPGSENVTALTTHPTIPKYIAGGSDKGVIAVWDVTTSSILMQASLMHTAVVDMAFSPCDDTITIISSDQKIAIYDQRLKERVHEKQFDLQLTTIAYAPRGNEIAVGTDQGHILSMDKRYLRSCRSGIKAHDAGIKKIRFQCESNNKFDYLSPKVSGCTIFQEPEREQHQAQGDPFGGIDSEIVCNVMQEDFHTKCQTTDSPRNIRLVATLPFEANAEKKSPPTTPKQAVGEMTSTFHIIDERSLREFKESVIQSTKELVDKVVEQVNTDFLKMRMNVSREFCNMELRNRERWQEMDDTMLTLACLDDSQLSEEIRLAMIHEEAVRDTPGHSRITKETKQSMDDEPSDIDYDDDEIDEEVTFDDNQSVESAGILNVADLNPMDYLEYDSMESPRKNMASFMPALPPGMGYSSEVRSTHKSIEVDEKKNQTRLPTKGFISKIPTQKNYHT